jgi:hypothetical protein
MPLLWIRIRTDPHRFGRLDSDMDPVNKNDPPKEVKKCIIFEMPDVLFCRLMASSVD